MSQFIPVELHHASRLLNHGPTVMITSFDEQSQRRNIMAAAWSMPVEFEPPRVAIVVDKSTWTRELIERNGKFGIVIPGVAATNWTWAVGSVSGREEDKFNCYGIPVISFNTKDLTEIIFLLCSPSQKIICSFYQNQLLCLTSLINHYFKMICYFLLFHTFFWLWLWLSRSLIIIVHSVLPLRENHHSQIATSL